MKTLDLIRFNPNWEEILQGAPYFIKTSWMDDYVLLKYNQLESDFSEEIVRECRGCIFYIPHGRHEWADIVCYPFEKFGNYGESYVPEIDWTTATVLEKVDGSLIKVWHHKGAWHVSTNGTIDARRAPTAVEGLSFYDIFLRALEKNGNSQLFFDALDPDYTYMFELVSPETRVTIEYSETAIYYLGARNIMSLEEIKHYWFPAADDAFSYFIRLPKQYPLTSLEDCINAANAMSKDEEGFVVSDQYFNRIKIKSPEYLIAAHLRNNGAITTKRVIEMARADQLDDFCAYTPQYSAFVDKVLDALSEYEEALGDMQAMAIKAREMEMPAKHFAEYLKREELRSDLQGFAFACFNGKAASAKDYLSKMSVGKLVEVLKIYMKDVE